MNDIHVVYSTSKRMDTSGIEGYQVNTKYYDPMKIKLERSYAAKDKPDPRPDVAHKTSFID